MAAAVSPIVFSDVAQDPAMGLDGYVRVPSDLASLVGYWNDSLVNPKSFEQAFDNTNKYMGAPGVALIDVDGDGDLDILATNGPNVPNSLFLNQLAQTGALSFVDNGVASGLGAPDLDSSGVCFGDLDNDGDDDVLVLGRHAHNRLFANDGTGLFTHVASSGLEAGTTSHMGCSMGDIDGDGLLDVYVGNLADLSTSRPFLGEEPWAYLEHNALFRNDGGLSFTDITASSGILDIQGTDSPVPNPATMTWAVSLVDIDLDGDIDILQSDDQAIPDAHEFGVNRGGLHIGFNDGTGSFTMGRIDEAQGQRGDWMGVSFGDLNCDGDLDVFASNLGDYVLPFFGNPFYTQGTKGSRWFLGNGDGTFVDENADGIATPFGWGNAVVDADNDGDQDILWHGSMANPMNGFEDNPGALLENVGCTGDFVAHNDAFPTNDYNHLGAQGMAAGDLDQDGYVDLVVTVNHEWPQGSVFPAGTTWGSPFDATQGFAFTMAPVVFEPEQLFSWTYIAPMPGRLTLELNDGAGAGSVAFRPVGSVGLTAQGAVNRSGIGAVMSFTPYEGATAMSPVMGGNSYLSQHALVQHFGLGAELWGTLDTQWPGDVDNRLHFVFAGERLVIPEIPCDIDGGDWPWTYYGCVFDATWDLYGAGEIDFFHTLRLQTSAIIAYWE